jgi:ATP-dependent Clp protease ATP-binding subunit ClpC
VVVAIAAAVELSDRYITDRFLPDKAVDLIDQAGARVRLRTKTPATDVRELERRLEQLNRDKDQAVAAEQYERASALRDEINEVCERIQRDSGAAGSVPEVTPVDIADVVSRATGIPVAQLAYCQLPQRRPDHDEQHRVGPDRGHPAQRRLRQR